MSKETKFTDEELSKLKEVQVKYIEVQNTLGQTAVQKLRLAQQINSLNDLEEKLAKEFKDTQIAEQQFLQTITDKYGQGSLDPQTGVYTVADTKTDE
jgi:hypothetical protein